MSDSKKITAITLGILLLSTAAVPFQIGSEQDNGLKLFDSIIGENILQDAYAQQPEENGPPENNGLLQKSIKQSVNKGKGMGKPVPDAEYENEVIQNGNQVIIKSKSTLKFDNPGKFNPNNPNAIWNFDDVATQQQIQDYIDLVNQQQFEKDGTHVYENDDDGDGKVDEDPPDGINDDNDCTDSATQTEHYDGNPNNNKEDDCYDENGDVRNDRIELEGEDPVGEHDFETQPITIQISETFESTLPSEEAAAKAILDIKSGQDAMLVIGKAQTQNIDGTSTTTQNVVMGFGNSISIFPNGQWTVEIATCNFDPGNLPTCDGGGTAFAWYTHTWKLNLNYGLRLPVEVKITSADTMIMTKSYPITAQITPKDLNAGEYQELGLNAFGGDEFVANISSEFQASAGFFLVELLDIEKNTTLDFVEKCSEFANTDCANFVTPFGGSPANEFPIPTFVIPCNALIPGCEIGIPLVFTVTLGLVIDPIFTSTKISATSEFSGDAEPESEEYVFSNTNPISIGTLVANNLSDSTDDATITLRDFEYELNRMDLDVSIAVVFSGFIGGLFEPITAIPIGTIPLADILPITLTIPQHPNSPNAVHNVFVEYYEFSLNVTPSTQSVKPGSAAQYTIDIQNKGNVVDTPILSIIYDDFGDNFRAVITAIQEAWTDVNPSLFDPLNPGDSSSTTFTVSIPGDWAGIEDTTYEFTPKSTSTRGQENGLDISHFGEGDLVVISTKESKARYVDFEILELVDDVDESNIKEGLKKSLTKQLLEAEFKKEQGLAYILDDEIKSANNMLSATSNKMGAFVSHVEAQNDKKINDALALDWIERGNIIIADLQHVIDFPSSVTISNAEIISVESNSTNLDSEELEPQLESEEQEPQFESDPEAEPETKQKTRGNYSASDTETDEARFLTNTSNNKSSSPQPSDNITDDKKGGGGDEHLTRPTFGVSHETFETIVDSGFRFNDQSFTINDNFHTPFAQQTVNIGEINTFEAKIYADKRLKVQEFLFGIPNVGEAHRAELGVEVWYDYNGEIEKVKAIQKSNVIDKETIVATHEKTKCQESDIEQKCDVTNVSIVFLESLKDKVMAVKAIDYKGRYQITYLNEGVEIAGESLNPMQTYLIPSNIRDGGLIKVTQLAKYSPYWQSDDGRMFEMNNFGSFKEINITFERFQDTGTAYTRVHSGFGGVMAYELKRATGIFDASELIKELPDYIPFSPPIISERMTAEMKQKMLEQEEIAKKILEESKVQARW